MKSLSNGARWAGLLCAGVLIGFVALAMVVAGEIYDYVDTVDGVHLPEVDAIVCLAGGRGRIAAAGDVWYRYWEQSHHPLGHPIPIDSVTEGRATSRKKPPILYISGMGRQSGWNTLARQVRRGVLDVLRPEHVLLETESTNTDENARLLARFAKQKKWDRILLMTSRYHMKRAKFIFEGVFWRLERPLHIETLSVYQEPFEPGEWRRSMHGIQVTLIEYIKWISYRFAWSP